jgi:TPR repeat protein
MDMTMNLFIALVLFAVFLVVLWYLSRRAGSVEPDRLQGLRDAATEGDVYSQFRLGRIYYEGDGVARDDREAARWFHQAAMNEHAEAQLILATMYEKGMGVPKSDEEAFSWYMKASSQGHERAKVILESAKWDVYRRKAAGAPAPPEDEMEDPSGAAVHHRGPMPGTGQEEENTALFSSYLARARAGDVDAQYNVGVMYYHGEGVARNHEEALQWFLTAAEQGDADAQYSLGFMYGRGEGTARDRGASLMWFKRAASRGHQGAQEIIDKMSGRS